MTTVFTIGYEGSDIAAFVAELRSAGIAILVDVRAHALSRKPGFSKRVLRSLLEANGIDYTHLSQLGDPKPGREAARAGRYAEFKRVYTAHLRSSESRRALDELARIANQDTTCLLCFERDPAVCHRSLLAERLKRSGMAVTDLFAGEAASYDRHAAGQPRRHLGEGAAATQ